MGQERHWINKITYIILDNYSGRFTQHLPHFHKIKIILKFNIYALTMAAYYRNAHAGRGYLDTVVANYFPRLVHHLHFLFGITIVCKHIYLRDGILIYGVLKGHFTRRVIPFIHQLIYAFYAGPGNALVG